MTQESCLEALYQAEKAPKLQHVHSPINHKLFSIIKLLHVNIVTFGLAIFLDSIYGVVGVRYI